MIDAVLAVLVGLVIRDLFFEAHARYTSYKFKKNLKTWKQYVEDWEADDEGL
jgi:hypothetical protein